MKKYLIALTLLIASPLLADKHTEVFYYQLDTMYLEAAVNNALCTLEKHGCKIKSVQYNDIDFNISSFMIVYERKK